MENIIPIVVSAKHLFEKERSPLLKDLLLYLKGLMQDYRNEISGKKFFIIQLNFYKSIFLFLCCAISYDIARAFGLCDTVCILATTVCFY